MSCLRMSTADKRIDLVQSHWSVLSADSRHVLGLPRRSMSAGRSQKGLFFDFFCVEVSCFNDETLRIPMRDFQFNSILSFMITRETVAVLRGHANVTEVMVEIIEWP